jgi:hypothetical protein
MNLKEIFLMNTEHVARYLAKQAKKKELAEKTENKLLLSKPDVLDQLNERTTKVYHAVHKDLEKNYFKKQMAKLNEVRNTEKKKRLSAIKIVILSIWSNNTKWEKKSVKAEKKRISIYCDGIGDIKTTKHLYRDLNDALDELVEEKLIPDCFQSSRKSTRDS